MQNMDTLSYPRNLIKTAEKFKSESIRDFTKEGAEFAIEKCPVGAEFGGQNINFLMKVFCVNSKTHFLVPHHIVFQEM